LKLIRGAALDQVADLRLILSHPKALSAWVALANKLARIAWAALPETAGT